MSTCHDGGYLREQNQLLGLQVAAQQENNNLLRQIYGIPRPYPDTNMHVIKDGLGESLERIFIFQLHFMRLLKIKDQSFKLYK